ncbi:GlsB/YeaQ/YmgE family stress response membrane protein [Myxococcus xanthus]|uniref:GlsB/YeaQ/YmgE family stress response membrane protein n=1 Tax=Myxococcus xanthus TaxID=34 RepID=UPI003451EA7F
MKVSRAHSIGLAMLVLSGPNAAWAQEPPASEPARAPASELTPPPLVPAPGGWDAPTRRDEDAGDDSRTSQETEGTTSVNEQALPGKARARATDPVPRVAVEFLGGAGGGIIAGSVGLITGFFVGASTVGCDECSIVAGVGGLTGVVVGIPAGTWLGGKLMGGRGTFLATAGGSLIGWGGTLLGSALLGIGDNEPGGAVFLLLLPVVGAVAGYELSSPGEERPALTRKAPSTFQVVPVAGMGERGPRLGLAGSF